MNSVKVKSEANQLRADILKMLYKSQSGHPGGSLSCVEMLMAIYNTGNMDPQNPKDENRDRVVLSKGHASPALYAVLADMGYFEKEELWNLRQATSFLQGHPDMHKTPGVDASTGSLGQGISIAVGMAIAAKQKKMDYKVFAVIGDGEIQEGLVWEAAMSAAHYNLDNLIVLLDHNGLQIDGSNDEVMSVGNVMDKFKSFDFECLSVDGHNVDEITDAINKETNGKPRFIQCRTHKGKGVSFMEDNFGWHGKAPNEEQYLKAIEELGGK